MVNINWIRQFPVFAGLPDPALAALARIMHRKRISARRILFYEGDPVTALYCIEHGRIRMSVALEDGEECTINILGDGEFFPHAGLLKGGTYPATASTMVDTEVALAFRDDLADLARREPEIAFHLLMEMGRRVEILQGRVRELTQRDLRVRVLCTLMRLATMHQMNEEDAPRPDEVDLNFHLTHEELAQMAGGARESVSRILSELRREGIIIHSSHGRLGLQMSLLERALASCRATYRDCPLFPFPPRSYRRSVFVQGRD